MTETLVRKKVSLVDILAVLQLTLLSLLFTIKFWSWDFDDGFIVYRYAENISSGRGWVYNAGEAYNASTSALNTILISFLCVLGLSPSSGAHSIGGAGLWMMCLSIYAIFRRHTVSSISTIVASACCIMMANNFTWGLESHLFFGLLSLYIALEVYGRTSWLLLGLLVLTRPDALLLVALRVLLSLSERRVPIRGVCTTLLVIAPWALFSVWSFGHIFPATLQQKRWQGTSGFWGTGWIFLQGMSGYIRGETFRHLAGTTWAPVVLTAPLALLPQGLLFVAQQRSKAMLLFGYLIAVLVAYTCMNVPNYHWYYAGLLLVICVGAGFGGLFILQQVPVKASPYINAGIIALCLIVTIRTLLHTSTDQFDLRTSVYRTLTEHILAETPAGASIAAVEVGVVGYYSRRPMIDIVGLTTPYGEFLTGAHSDRLLTEIQPSVIILHEPLMIHEEAIYGDPLFVANYRKAGVITTPGYPELSFFIRAQRNTVPTSLGLTKTRLNDITEQSPTSFVVHQGDPWIEYKLSQPADIPTPALTLSYSLSNSTIPPKTPIRARVYIASAGQSYSEERAYPVMLRTGLNNQATIHLVGPGSSQDKPNPFEHVRFDVIQTTELVGETTFEVSSVGVVGLK